MDTPENRLAEGFIFYIAGLLFFTVGAISTLGLTWYHALIIPSWAPSTLVTLVVWCVIFIMLALSAARVWSNGLHSQLGWYGLNVFLLLLWNYVFFGAHLTGISVALAVLVLLSLIKLLVITSRMPHKAVWLLLPYLAWMLFALPLVYYISVLN